MPQKSNSTNDSVKSMKFLYSYGGKILIRHSDGKLRYVGGYTRVLSVDPSISYAELIVKFSESCGSSVDLKCKLPNEDLDVLVSVKSDEELRIVIDEYRRASPEAKIRALLFPIQSGKKVSPPSSPMSCFDFPSVPKPKRAATTPIVHYCTAPPCVARHRCVSPAVRYPTAAGKCHCCHQRQYFVVPRENHSQ